jgi:hypothetical protein
MKEDSRLAGGGGKGRRKFVGNTDPSNKPDRADGDPRPAAVTFVTTEHFTLQGARSSTISESTG